MSETIEQTENDFLSGLPPALIPGAHTFIDLGWSLTLRPDQPADVRKRLEAEHPDGHRLLIVTRPTARAGRPLRWTARNNRYFAQPTTTETWYRLSGMQAATFYATHATLPNDARPADTDPSSAPSNKLTPRCDCEKRRFTRSKAERVLLAAKMKRGLEGNARRRERRVYQCDTDHRVWHLTSRETWHQ